MSYDEGRWTILPFDPTERPGTPVVEVASETEDDTARVGRGYILAHLSALGREAADARFLIAGDGDDDCDPVLSEGRDRAARVGFRFRVPLQPDAVPFRSVERCEAAILVEGRGWLGCHPRREGVCLGWSTEPRWEWAIECLHATGCGETIVTGADLRLWNQEAEDFLVFDSGEFGPSLRWLTDYQRLQRMSVGAWPAEPRVTGAGV